MENTIVMLILASQSATRKALLEQAGLPFSTKAAQLDERAVEQEVLAGNGSATDVALTLAQAKALSVGHGHPGAVVIGADQTLALHGTLLHKPADRSEARQQLDRLCGQTHHLHAAVALVRGAEILWSACESAELTMRRFSAAERERVMEQEGDRILSSVGSYRLEGPSIRLFERVTGDYFTILGLPLLPLLAALRIHAPEVLL